MAYILVLRKSDKSFEAVVRDGLLVSLRRDGNVVPILIDESFEPILKDGLLVLPLGDWALLSAPKLGISVIIVLHSEEEITK